MNAIDFEYLLSTIGPRIAKRDTNMRRCITVQERLGVALRFLATGDSFISLSYLFKISKESVSICVEDLKFISHTPQLTDSTNSTVIQYHTTKEYASRDVKQQKPVFPHQ